MDPILVNVILIAVLVVIVGLAALYIYRSKKAGAVCIGCPYAKQCGKKSSGCCGGNNSGCNCGSENSNYCGGENSVSDDNKAGCCDDQK